MNLFGIKVIESRYLPKLTVPNRKHKRRSWMSDAYHHRIQKKWTKRFGTHEEECAVFMSPRAVGLPLDDMLALPPGHITLLRGMERSSLHARMTKVCRVSGCVMDTPHSEKENKDA